ncbi:hypothetical protein GCM10010912_65850 [Paenibacillus albidus]|uniref:Uncharacterized protein n=1 Tax=Paenibacillus albidus TaxID=2041023 RepID=A0A917FXG0_9BACL|nr:hypothetical protein [Paenibacillus albidus]GGG12253.1 hypothetical protein GCM10010912_65850 [Paenibacillus albidus]
MAWLIVFMIIGCAFIAAYILSKDKSPKRKYIVWGSFTMLPISPLISWIVSMLYADYVHDGFAGIGLLMILTPLLFIVGLVLLLIGLFRKDKIGSD